MQAWYNTAMLVEAERRFDAQPPNPYEVQEIIKRMAISAYLWNSEREAFAKERAEVVDSSIVAEKRSELVEDNASMQQAYEEGLGQLGTSVVVDGVVGSLSFGVASVRMFGSDIDGTVVVRSFAQNAGQRLAAFLEKRNIKGNITVVSETGLAGLSFHEKLRAMNQLMGGMHTRGDGEKAAALVKTIIPTAPLSLYAEWLQGHLDTIGRETQAETLERYRQRIKLTQRLMEGYAIADVEKLYPLAMADLKPTYLSQGTAA